MILIRVMAYWTRPTVVLNKLCKEYQLMMIVYVDNVVNTSIASWCDFV